MEHTLDITSQFSHQFVSEKTPSGTLFIHHAPNVTSDIRRDHYDFSTFGRRQSELCVYGIECIEGGIGSAGPDLGQTRKQMSDSVSAKAISMHEHTS